METSIQHLASARRFISSEGRRSEIVSVLRPSYQAKREGTLAGTTPDVPAEIWCLALVADGSLAVAVTTFQPWLKHFEPHRGDCVARVLTLPRDSATGSHIRMVPDHPETVTSLFGLVDRIQSDSTWTLNRIESV